MTTLDIAELRNQLRYDPDTGEFWWTVPHHKRQMNRPVGSYDRDGYKRIFYNKRLFALHRLAFYFMTGSMPLHCVDHINGVRDDNRWCNLRLATRAENMQNKKKQTNTVSQYPGLSFHAGKWQCNIGFNNKRIYLGRYHTEEDAALAYILVKQRLHSFNPTAAL